MLGSAKPDGRTCSTAGSLLKRVSRWSTCYWIGASLILLACGGRSRDSQHRDDGGRSTQSFSEAGVDGGSNNEDAGQHSAELSSASTLVTYETGDASSGASGSSDVAATNQPESVGTTAAQSTETWSSPQPARLQSRSLRTARRRELALIRPPQRVNPRQSCYPRDVRRRLIPKVKSRVS